jgi:RND family efflux transporter MFP subunit
MRTRAARAAFFIALACTPVVGASLAACHHDDAAAQGPAGAGSAGASAGRGGGPGGKQRGATFPVDVMAVESKKVDYVILAPGTIDAFEHVQVTARVAGVVDKVAFEEGSQVKAGQVLVVIEAERYQLAVNSAKASLAKAQATQADSEAAASRRTTASSANPGLIPAEEVATYKTKVETAKADTAAAGEQVKVAEVNLRDAYVRAPIDGAIQTRTVETGQYVNPGYLMATLLRSDPLLLRFQVEPQDAPRLKPGMTAKFAMRETQDQYEAKITLVSGAADATTHTVGVTAEVHSEKKYWLRPGSFCDVTVDVGATRDAPVIPRAATRATDHGYIVYVVDGEQAVEKVITLGMNTKDGWVEVRSGLKGGELLVVRGVEALANGASVRASKVDSLDASAPEIPLQLDGGRRGGDGGGGGGHKTP